MTKKKVASAGRIANAPTSVGDIIEYRRFGGGIARLEIVKIVESGEKMAPEEIDLYYPPGYRKQYPTAAAEELKAKRYIGEFLDKPGAYMVLFENNFRDNNSMQARVVRRLKETA